MKVFFSTLAFVLVLGIGVVALAARQGAAIEARERHVGATVKPYALNLDSVNRAESAIPAQVKLVTELNGSIIRVNAEAEMATNDALINTAHDAGLDVLLVLEVGENPIRNQSLSLPTLEKLGYDTGFLYADRYKDQVNFYQLANEVSGTAVTQPGDTGPTIPNRYNLTYNKARYDRIRAYTQGLSDGVHAADPQAKRVVTGHWVLIDIIKKLIDDGVDFEIVGWDWYSDMGTDPSAKRVDGQPTLDFPGTVNGWGKEFWLVELNKEAGSYDNTENEQAAYLRDVAEIMEKDQRIQGLIVHMLSDVVYDQRQNNKIGWLGIVEAKQQGTNWILGKKKAAFTTLSPIFARINAQAAPATGLWDSFARTMYERLQALK